MKRGLVLSVHDFMAQMTWRKGRDSARDAEGERGL